jgi:dihydrofolate synthase/folylpolyglutamate synthase
LLLFFKKEALPSMSDIPKLARGTASGRTDAIIDRLHTLYPKLIDLSLDRVQRLLGLLGNPQDRLPPIIHVAGTNGKGSTCAFLRAIGEAAGLRVHVTISPHLVHLRERFRIAGELVSEEVLAATIEEIEAVNAGGAVTVFEALAATGFLLFSRTPADLCVVEVGLGGRYDATNLFTQPAACAITSISLDHQDFLGDKLDRIAWEKAGIMKHGRPVATGRQPAEAALVLRACAAETGALLLERGRDWEVTSRAHGLFYTDVQGSLELPLPSLPGMHQFENAGIAVAALRASGVTLPASAYSGIATAEWPARLQRLQGKLARMLPPGVELWLDGGHNAGAGIALGAQLRAWNDCPVHIVVGMKQSKDAGGFLAPLLPHASSVWAVREPGQHMALPIEAIVEASSGVARVGPDVAGALAGIARLGQQGRVLICGSLYLAGEILKAEGGPT